MTALRGRGPARRDVGGSRRRGARGRPRRRAALARSRAAPGGGEPVRRWPSPAARPRASDWPFPFPAPGRPRPHRSRRACRPATAHRWPFRRIDAPPLPNRGVAAPDRARRRSRREVRDVGRRRRRDLDRRSRHRARARRGALGLPARALARLPDRRGEQGRRCSRATCRRRTTSSTRARSASSQMGHRTVKLVNALGGEGLTTTIGWPQEVGQRWADKIWPLSHKLVAQAAGLGVIGTQPELPPPPLRRLLPDRHRGDQPRVAVVRPRPSTWNPCLQCNLCVASCPTEAIRRTARSTSSPATTTPIATRSRAFSTWWATWRSARRGSSASAGPTTRSRALAGAVVPGRVSLLQLRRHLPRRDRARVPRRPRGPAPLPRRDAEAAHPHARRSRTRSSSSTRPARASATASRPASGGRPIDRASPRSAEGVRLVNLRRIRTQNVDAMMRWMPQYFRPTEARGPRLHDAVGADRSGRRRLGDAHRRRALRR